MYCSDLGRDQLVLSYRQGGVYSPDTRFRKFKTRKKKNTRRTAARVSREFRSVVVTPDSQKQRGGGDDGTSIVVVIGWWLYPDAFADTGDGERVSSWSACGAEQPIERTVAFGDGVQGRQLRQRLQL